MEAGEEKKPEGNAAAASDRSPLPVVEGPEAGLEALRVMRHDFKTPLTSLKMLGQIFKLGLEKGTLNTQPERTERNCRMLIEQVDKLVELADDLYEISVAQSGRLQLQRQLADLRPILNNALTKFDSRIRSIQLPEQPVWGQWDTQRLCQAFCHLLNEVEAADVSIVLKEGLVEVFFKGDFKDSTEKTAPRRFLARAVIEKHGGTLADRFEVTLPITCQ